jgi:hypothetical protein
MRKEVIIAILIGFTIGIIVTFGIKIAQQSLDRRHESRNSPELDSQRALAMESAHTLSVTTPLAHTIHRQDSVEITGITTPGSFISLVTSKSEAVAMADKLGNFNGVVDIALGANIVTINSFNQTGELASKSLEIIYSNVDIKPQDSYSTSSSQVVDQENDE